MEKLESEKAWLLLEVERLTGGAAPADGAQVAEKPKGLDATSIDREMREAFLEMKKELANAQVSPEQNRFATDPETDPNDPSSA